MSQMHKFHTREEAELAKARWERLGHTCFSLFELVSDGKVGWAFWVC
jgi:hypothetical protein